MTNQPVNHNRLNQTDWQRLMTEYEAGDVSQRAFCAQRGIAHSTFCYWRARLRRLQHNENPDTSLQALSPLLELSSLPLSDAFPSWRVELELGDGLVLRVR